MYYYFDGKLVLCTVDTAVIDCAGVGYKLAISANTFKKINGKETCRLYAYLNVKEDDMSLFGFVDEQEKMFFTLLLSVSGVGPKVALSVLSEMHPEEFAACVLRNDANRIKKTPGIGPKMAQRICLELRDKISKASTGDTDIADAVQSGFENSSKDDALAALVTLGYQRSEAKAALDKCLADNTEDLIRQALRILSRNVMGMN